MFDCCIWNVTENVNINKVVIDLEINDKDSILVNYDLVLDLNLMGLTTDDDYVDELCRDIKRFINVYYKNNNKIPIMEEIKQEMESKNWLETKVWLENGII